MPTRKTSRACSATLAARVAPDAKAASILVAHVPAPVVSYLTASDCRIVVLADGQRYRDASPALARLGVDVDAWPVPPAGLTVVEERTIYVRSVDAMTVVHETGHLLDLALGSGVYYSACNDAFRRNFNAARSFVTPYAASGLDEYFAEAFRAACGANLAESPWPMVSPQRLSECDTALANLMALILTNPSIVGVTKVPRGAEDL